MHKSRLGVAVIDCPEGDIHEYAAFWAEALGWELASPRDDPKYRDLKGPDSELRMLLQTVDHAPRVHLDIETDNIPAEVARLEKAGAKVVGPCKSWVVMEAPSGHRFCVVEPQRADFEENANLWPD